MQPCRYLLLLAWNHVHDFQAVLMLANPLQQRQVTSSSCHGAQHLMLRNTMLDHPESRWQP